MKRNILSSAELLALKQGKIVLDGAPLLRAEYIIPFKAKAWLDLSERKANGEQMDSKNIRKHKNDVFRLSALLGQNTKVKLSSEIQKDMRIFLGSIAEELINLKQLGLNGYNQDQIISFLRTIYFMDFIENEKCDFL